MTKSTPKTPIKQPETKVKVKQLTRKQRIFVKHIIDNPKASGTEAALKAYDTTDYQTAASIANENLKKPEIISELSKYNGMIESTLLNAVNKYKDSDKLSEVALAVDTSKWLHDKVHGKAMQKSESKVLSVNINAEVSQEIAEDFTAFMKQKTIQQPSSS